jgi:hypothetical protein
MAAPAQKIALQFTFEGQTLDWDRYFQAFEMRKSISEKASQAVFTFLGVPMDLVAKSSLRANKNLEFGWGNPPNMSIPHNYVIHGIDQSYEGDTSIVRLNLIDNRVHLQADSAFSAYPHKSFSEIVKDVAGTYKNLPPAVVAEAKHLTNLTQTGSNHWVFLSALQREGANSKGDSSTDYRLFFKGGNELHFHAPDYKQAPYKTINLFTSTVAPDSRIRFSPWKSILGGSQGYKASTFLRDEVRPYSSPPTKRPPSAAMSGWATDRAQLPRKSRQIPALHPARPIRRPDIVG